MEPSTVCDGCKLEVQRLKSITAERRAQRSAFLQRKAHGDLSETQEGPLDPLPSPRQKYDLPSSMHPKCSLCSLFSIAFPTRTEDQLVDIFPLSWYLNTCDAVDSDRQEWDDMCIAVEPRRQSLVIMSDTSTPAKFGRPKAPRSFVDWQSIKAWIKFCAEHHGGECRVESGSQEIKGLKLVDCITCKVVNGDDWMKWVALSYVWSLATPRSVSSPKGSPCDLQQGEAFLPASLPGVVCDAMEATLELGYRYLWVDQFCIDQSNKDEVADQVGQMDKIYRGAVLTIMAVSAKNGLPGATALPRIPSLRVTVGTALFFVTRMDPVSDIKNSTWQTRGWCYQEEMLSCRRLYFTEEGVVFQCYKTIGYEMLGGPELLNNPEDREAKSEVNQVQRRWDPRRGLSYKSNFNHCLMGKQPRLNRPYLSGQFHIMTALEVISEFTKRKLSFDVDSLNAVTGVLNIFADLDPPVRFYQGLPVSQDISQFSSSDILVHSLCWYHCDPDSSRRLAHLPSWCWAGWSGAIEWPHMPLEESAFTETTQARLRDWNGSNPRSDAEVLALNGGCGDHAPFSSRHSQVHDCRLGVNCSASSAKYMLLDVRCVPSSLFTFRAGSTSGDRTWDDLIFDTENHPTDYAELCGPDEGVTRLTSALTDPEVFLDRMQTGELGCLFLGDQLEVGGDVSIHLLAVEWVGGYVNVAQRFGLIRFSLQWDSTTHGNTLFSQLSALPKKRVWLI